MLYRVAVLKRQEGKSDVLVIPAQEIIADSQAEAKIIILMDNAEAAWTEGQRLRDIPKKELVVVCSDFMNVKI